MPQTWLLRIWLLFFCWPFWNLFSLAFMLTSEGLMISAEAELSSWSGLRHFAWSQRHTFDNEILPEDSTEVLWLQWSLRYKEILTFICTFQSFGQLEVQVPALCDPERGGSVFIFVQDLCDSRETKDIHLDFTHPFLGPFLKNIQPVRKSYESSGKETTGQCPLHGKEASHSLGTLGYPMLVIKSVPVLKSAFQ